MPWLVAGLGNPGDRYATSRHNVGRLTIDALARPEGARFRKTRFLAAEVAEIHMADDRILLVRSTRFMNESGSSYASLAKKHEIEPVHIVAVHDELDIPADTLRVKAGGGNNGHNGLRSLQQALGTGDFLRVRVGIGRPPGRQDPADFVLEPLPKRLQTDFAILAEHAAEAVRSLIEVGIEATQDRFNGSGPSA